MATKHSWRRVFIGGSLLLFAVRCGALPPTDFLCEAAVAHLADCCPGLVTAQLDCVTANDGCAYTSLPLLQPSESRCILGLDCRELEKDTLCEKVPALPPAIHTTTCDGSFVCAQVDYDRPPVCP